MVFALSPSVLKGIVAYHSIVSMSSNTSPLRAVSILDITIQPLVKGVITQGIIVPDASPIKGVFPGRLVAHGPCSKALAWSDYGVIKPRL